MKYRSKNVCGYRMSVNQRSEDCTLHIVCNIFFLFLVPIYKERKHDVTETLWNSVYE